MTDADRMVLLCAIWQAMGALRTSQHEENQVGLIIYSLQQALNILEKKPHLKVVE